MKSCCSASVLFLMKYFPKPLLVLVLILVLVLVKNFMLVLSAVELVRRFLWAIHRVRVHVRTYTNSTCIL